jgi:hypothetical protein
MLKETVVACSEILSQNSPERAMEDLRQDNGFLRRELKLAYLENEAGVPTDTLCFHKD